MKKIVTTALLLTFSIGISYGAPSNWEQYCSDGIVKANSSDIPKVNYKNSLISKVAKIFTEIELTETNARMKDEKWETDTKTGIDFVKSVAFNPYTDIENTYGLCSGKRKYTNKCKSTQLGPDGVGINTHNMLTILCGEYRDNFKMFKKKLSWLSKTTVTPVKKQGYSKSKKVFPKLL